MGYRDKIVSLSVLVIALAAIYAASAVRDPERAAERADRFPLLDGRRAGEIERIELTTPSATVVLRRGDGGWIVIRDAEPFPGKGHRVAALLADLSAVSSYPLRSFTAGAHAAIALTEAAASRIAVYGRGDAPLLDLLVGMSDAVGDGAYMRLAGKDESFVGRDRFTRYLAGDERSWFDLSLFSSEPVSADGIQSITVTASARSYTLARDGGPKWTLLETGTAADSRRAEEYADRLAAAEADDFAPTPGGVRGVATITVETGEGRSRRIVIGPPDGEGRRIALVSGSPYRFFLSEATAEGLVKDEPFFYERAAMNDR